MWRKQIERVTVRRNEFFARGGGARIRESRRCLIGSASTPPAARAHLIVRAQPNDVIQSRPYARRLLSTAHELELDDEKDANKQQSFLQVIRQQILDGKIEADEAQLVAAKRLNRLQENLVGYTNEPFLIREQVNRERRAKEAARETTGAERKSDSSESSAITNTQPSAEAPPTPPTLPRIPRGFYLYGSVGTGKSMLLDTFFANCTVRNKQRHHFHAFLAHVHARIHALKQEDLATTGRNFTIDLNQQNNPIHRVGLQLAAETAVLCFDEFQVTDICDAVILSQLFGVLWQMGTVVVATSNRPATDLYEGGLNRSYFLPFIDQLERHCVVHDMSSVTDYRLLAADQGMYMVQSEHDDDARKQVDERVQELRGDRPETCVDLDVGFKRKLTVASADEDGWVGRFRFDELCDRDLGASDFRALAQHFSIVVLEDVPVMNKQEHNKARRFITLVDELYEARTALVISAVAPPERLFVGANETVVPLADDSAEDLLSVDQAVSHGHAVGALASVQELSFAFQRAASRLTEMTSRGWWERHVL